MRLVRHIAAVSAITLLGLIGLTTVAHAHVGVTDATTAADGVTTVEFAFSHGCGTSPTTALELQLPPDAQLLSASLADGWDVATTTPTLRLEGTPVPDGTTSGFSLALTGYDTSVDHLVPTVQYCEAGELAWVEPDESGDYPAPVLVATTPGAPPTTVPAENPETSEPDDTGVISITEDFKPPTDGNDTHSAHTHSDGAPWAIIAIGGGTAVIAAVGAVVLARRRSRAS